MHDYSVEIHRKAFPAEQTHGKRKAEAFRSRLHSRPTVNTLRRDLAICRLDVVHREYAGRFRYDTMASRAHTYRMSSAMLSATRVAASCTKSRARCKMRIPGGGLDFPMTQQPPDHRKTFASHAGENYCPLRSYCPGFNTECRGPNYRKLRGKLVTCCGC